MKNKKLSLISVIIPCFNSGKTIQRTIDSINYQTWEQKEIIVVNDGSHDKETLIILNQLRGVKILNQKNNGLPSARNNGVKNAIGEFLLFLDADDWLEPYALEFMFEKLLAASDSSFVFADIKLEGEAQKIISKKYNFFEQLFLNQLPYCILISKENFERIGGYDEKMKHGYEDWEFNIRLGLNNIFGINLELPAFHYSVNSSGMLISKSSKYHSEIWKYIKEKNKHQYNTNKLIKSWLKWRAKPSNYPLGIFFVWLIISNILPDVLMSKIFIYSRNVKWFLVRSKLFNNKKLF